MKNKIFLVFQEKRFFYYFQNFFIFEVKQFKNSLIRFFCSNFFKVLSYLFFFDKIFFFRKEYVFNKGRYSRNRQVYKTGVY